MLQVITLLCLLVVSATVIQANPIWFAFRIAWFARNGIYRTKILTKTYFWVSRPKCYKDVTDPDFILLEDGSLVFFNQQYLHASVILTYLPIIPAIAFFLVKLQIHRFRNIDKYILKSSEIDEYKHLNSEQGS